MSESSYEMVLSVTLSGWGRPEDAETTRENVERALRTVLHRDDLKVEVASINQIEGVPAKGRYEES